MLSSFVSSKRTVTPNLSRQELAKALWDKESLIWVDLENPTEFESEILIELFNFHPLAIEDCLVDHSEPKIDEYDDHLFLVVHAVDKTISAELETIELNIFLSKNYVVTFHNKPTRCITQVRDIVLRKSDSPLVQGLDVLLHAVLDRLVDDFLPVLSEHERRVEEIEDDIFKDSGSKVLPRILRVQKDVLYIKRIIGPQRDTMSLLAKSSSAFIRPKKVIYFRDVYDHLFRLHQTAEEVHGLLNGILQVYYSHMSHRLNEVIRTMTVIATVALPMMVLSGIYGMNFEHIPELSWKYGYYYIIGVMTLISILLLSYMKIKKWF